MNPSQRGSRGDIAPSGEAEGTREDCLEEGNGSLTLPRPLCKVKPSTTDYAVQKG